MRSRKALSKPQKHAIKDILKGKPMCISSDCGFGKCLSPDTKVIMFDGSIRFSKDVHVGDVLLGDDDKPRNVISRNDGQSPMYEVIPIKGESWGCNVNHTLCTVSSNRNSFGKAHQYVNVDMNDYLNLSKTTKSTLKQYTKGFDGWKQRKYAYDPYFFGIWLGDGTTNKLTITNADFEVVEYLEEFAHQHQQNIRVQTFDCTKAITCSLGQGSNVINPLLNYLREHFMVDGVKNLPDYMVTVHRQERLSLLAGLLDADGYYLDNGFEIVQKLEHLADSICKLSRSLGFFVTRTIKVVNDVNYYRLYITGDLTQIPNIIARRQAKPRVINKHHNRVGFSVKHVGWGNYVGLSVDGNKKFLLHDFTVCHNTVVGLTVVVDLLKKKPKTKTLIVCTPGGVKTAWTKEYLNWEHTKHLKVCVLTGTPSQRLCKFRRGGDIYAISYNSLKWLEKVNIGKDYVKFKFVFADEASCLKGPTSSWRKSLIAIAPHVKYKVLSTATPKTKEEDDYWGLCQYLDGGKALKAKTISLFHARYCSSFTYKNREIWRVLRSEVPKLEKRIKHLFVKYALSESATIPIKVITNKVKLSKSSAKKYKKLQLEQCLNSFVTKEDSKGLIVRDHYKSLDAGLLSAKLAQLSNGFLYMDENVRIDIKTLKKTTDVTKLLKDSKKRVVLDVFDDRIRAFKKMIKRIHKKHGKDVNIVIPYFHQHELTQLKRAIPNGVSDTEKNFESRFQKGEIKYLFLQYNRSSKALNLQVGGYIMAFYSPTFNWEDDYQIVRRLARQGQPAPKVYAYRLYMKGTVDEVKTKRLTDRFIGHARFQALIRRNV